MKKRKSSARWRGGAAVAVAVSLVLLAVGCAGTFGRLKRNPVVQQAFDSYEVMADYTYYITGSNLPPDAIIGIHRDYTLQTELWKRVEPTREDMIGWVGAMNREGNYVSNFPLGMDILDDEGKKIGIYYSIQDWTTIRLEGKNTVAITTPGKIREGQNRQRHSGRR